MFNRTLPALALIGVALTITACSSNDVGNDVGGGDESGAADAGGDTGDIDGSEGPEDSGTDGSEAMEDGGTDGPDGSDAPEDSGADGEGGPVDPAACREKAESFEPCGGELTGTWDLDDACKENQLDLPTCPEFSGALTIGYAPGYSITFDEDELSLPETTRTLTLDASLPLSCTPELDMGEIEDCASLSGPESGTCTGEAICHCVNQLIEELPASQHAYYSTLDGGLSLGEAGAYEYCVQGQTLLVKGRGLGEGTDGDNFVYVFTRR